MKAQDENRMMLEALMGASGAGTTGTQSQPAWQGKDVCKFFLIGFCPYEFFKNSKVDLGSCKENHMDAMRDAFLATDPAEREPYERKYRQALIGMADSMVRETEARIA